MIFGKCHRPDICSNNVYVWSLKETYCPFCLFLTKCSASQSSLPINFVLCWLIHQADVSFRNKIWPKWVFFLPGERWLSVICYLFYLLISLLKIEHDPALGFLYCRSKPRVWEPQKKFSNNKRFPIAQWSKTQDQTCRVLSISGGSCLCSPAQHHCILNIQHAHFSLCMPSQSSTPWNSSYSRLFY